MGGKLSGAVDDGSEYNGTTAINGKNHRFPKRLIPFLINDRYAFQIPC